MAENDITNSQPSNISPSSSLPLTVLPSNHPTFYTFVEVSNQKPSSSDVHDGSLETPSAKKSRGRPPGSKNKPKPPPVIYQVNEKVLIPVIVEIPDGFDVVESLFKFAHRRNVSITVLSGSGTISNVTLHNHSSYTPPSILHGPFNIVSLSGTYINKSPFASSSSSKVDPPCPFVISISKTLGQGLVGVVAGKVVALNEVIVVVTTFKSPESHNNDVRRDGKKSAKKSNNNHNPDDASDAGGNLNMFGIGQCC